MCKCVRMRLCVDSRDHPGILVVNGTAQSAVTGTGGGVVFEEATGVEVDHATRVHDGTTLQLLLTPTRWEKSKQRQAEAPGWATRFGAASCG